MFTTAAQNVMVQILLTSTFFNYLSLSLLFSKLIVLSIKCGKIKMKSEYDQQSKCQGFSLYYDIKKSTKSSYFRTWNQVIFGTFS